MPSARSQSRSRSSSRPVKVQPRFTVSQIRWDRKFRAILLVVLALVAWIGFQGFTSLLHTRAQAEHELRLVSALVAKNKKLEAQQKSLQQPSTIARDARALGMVRRGEQAYVVTGLSGN